MSDRLAVAGAAALVALAVLWAFVLVPAPDPHTARPQFTCHAPEPYRIASCSITTD